MQAEQVESPFWNLFSAPIEDNSTIEYEFIEVQENNVNVRHNEAYYEFFTRDLDLWLRLSKSYLIIKGHLAKEDNTFYADGDEIALVNNGFSLFQSIDYEINNQLIERIDNVSIATTVKALIEFSKDYSSSVATNMFWYRDTAQGMPVLAKYTKNEEGVVTTRMLGIIYV
jgi:hypothetical protein